MRVYVVRKWLLRGRSRFVCWNITQVNLWLLCNVHFVQSTQRTLLKDYTKVNVFCAISSQKVCGPFFFAEGTITGMTYLDMLQPWLMPQLQNIQTFIFQQDGSPIHFHCEVRQYLNTVLPGRWMGRVSGNDQPLMLWPPRSPDITPCEFFLWGCVKDRVFIPALHRDLADLKAWIIAAVKNIDAPMLMRVWQELQYRIDVCCVTHGAHVEHL